MVVVVWWQASSVIYPMALAQQYFLRHPSKDTEALSRKADEYLKQGLDKLMGYETPGGTDRHTYMQGGRRQG